MWGPILDVSPDASICSISAWRTLLPISRRGSTMRSSSSDCRINSRSSSVSTCTALSRMICWSRGRAKLTFLSRSSQTMSSGKSTGFVSSDTTPAAASAKVLAQSDCGAIAASASRRRKAARNSTNCPIQSCGRKPSQQLSHCATTKSGGCHHSMAGSKAACGLLSKAVSMSRQHARQKIPAGSSASVSSKGTR